MRLIALAFSVLAAAIAGHGRADAQTAWGRDYFPNFTLIDQDGKSHAFYDDLLQGRIVVINFMYTSCADICPLMTARMAEIVSRLGDRVGRDIFVYSISLDPERDTPEVMKAYAEAFAAPPGWLFLTGSREDIDIVRHKLGERSRSLGEHRTDMVLGNDTTGEWSRASVFEDYERAVMTILAMDPVWRDTKRTIAADNYQSAVATRIDDQPGRALFMRGCASCHTIGEGKRIGPDLKGLTQRRPRSWIERFMMEPDALIAEGDPTALALAEEYKGVKMPNLGLGAEDVADLIAYIETAGSSGTVAAAQ